MGETVVKKLKKTVVLSPRHKEWHTAGPGKAVVHYTKTRLKKPLWYKPWTYAWKVGNVRVHVQRRKKTTADHVKEGIHAHTRRNAQTQLPFAEFLARVRGDAKDHANVTRLRALVRTPVSVAAEVQ